jgi:FkbM family methyltransferase
MNNVNKNMLSDIVTVVPIAIGKEKGKLKFSLENEVHTGWGGFVLDSNSNSIEVQVDTLDNYTSKNNITKVDVLKIDTEGADTWVLYGCERLLKEKKIQNIFFEHNIVRMDLLKIKQFEAEEFLEKHDYVVERHSPTEFYAYPKK